MSAEIVQAPAKINLFLEVFPRPPEARLHPVDTVLEKVDLCDLVRLEVTPGRIELECNLPELANQENLAWRAAVLLKERFSIRAGVRIGLEKRIPLQAGLGGGSSDAAAVLLTLNRLWALQLPRSELDGLALELGSDVPAFLEPGRCRATGYGQQVAPLPFKSRWNYLLFLTGIAISTGEAYREIDNLTYLPASSKIILRGVELDDFSGVSKGLFNRFEEVALSTRDEVKRFKEEIDRFYPHNLLCGSGGAFFALVKEAEAGETGNIQRLSQRLRCRIVSVTGIRGS